MAVEKGGNMQPDAETLEMTSLPNKHRLNGPTLTGEDSIPRVNVENSGGNLPSPLDGSAASREGEDDWITNPIAKTLSAGLYLFDYVSNIVVLWTYYDLYKHHKFADVSDVSLGLVPFIVCLGFMVFDPVVAAVAFKRKLSPRVHPLRSAFFLPIVQFQRFIAGVFKTSTCASGRQGATESLETEALFAITSAMETGPQLVLQVTVIALIGVNPDKGRISATLWLSLIASIASASYNAGRAIMFQMSKRWTLTLNVSGIFGGIYTAGTLIRRCTAVATLVSVFGDSFSDKMAIIAMILYFAVGICLLSYVNGLLVLFSKGRDMWSWAAQVEVAVAAYMSATIGPLYPVIEIDSDDAANTTGPRPKCSQTVRIGVAAAINALPDVFVIVLSITPMPHTYPICKPGTVQTSAYYYTNSDFVSCPKFIAFVCIGLLDSLITFGVLVRLLRLLFIRSRPRRESPSNPNGPWRSGAGYESDAGQGSDVGSTSAAGWTSAAISGEDIV